MGTGSEREVAPPPAADRASSVSTNADAFAELAAEAHAGSELCEALAVTNAHAAAAAAAAPAPPPPLRGWALASSSAGSNERVVDIDIATDVALLPHCVSTDTGCCAERSDWLG